MTLLLAPSGADSNVTLTESENGHDVHFNPIEVGKFMTWKETMCYNNIV